MNLTELNSETLVICKKEDLLLFAESLINIKSEPEKKQDPEIEQPISMKEAVKYLGKSRQTLADWRRKGIIKGHTFSGKVYFLKSEILEALTKSK